MNEIEFLYRLLRVAEDKTHSAEERIENIKQKLNQRLTLLDAQPKRVDHANYIYENEKRTNN